MPAPSPTVVVGVDTFGAIAVGEDGVRFYLTPCCFASAKGGGEGVICRACYEPIRDALGGIPQQTAEKAAEMIARGCPESWLKTAPEIKFLSSPMSIADAKVLLKAVAG